MNIQLTRMYAILIGTLGIVGLFVSGHLLELMNVDIALDVLRILLTGYLVYVGFIAKSDRQANFALNIVGALYIGMALLGLISPTVGGLLPSGLTGFDVVFHLLTGGLALYAGMHHKNTAHAGA